MRLSAAVVLSFTLFLLLSAGAAADMERWLLVVQSTSGAGYYIDANSLSYNKGNNALAWFKIMEDKKSNSYSRIRDINIFGESFKQYEYTKALCEISCSASKLKVLTISAYGRREELIHRDETLAGQWTAIPDGSCFDTIRKVVCKR